MTELVITKEQLAELLEKALNEFPHSECPYCQSYIGLEKYIDREDIMKWLSEVKNVLC